MLMRLRAGGRTDAGRIRALNEDVYSLHTADGLFVVCDGMGGCPAGEVASQLAADAIVDELTGRTRAHGAARAFQASGPFQASDALQASGSPRVEERRYLAQTIRLADAVRHSNQIVFSRAQEDPSRAGMGTTVVGAWINGHVASIAHVGDSRAYLWHRDTLEQLTSDHSLVEAEVRAGLLSREAGQHAEQQNILLRALGREPSVEVELTEVLMQRGDCLLLCSDGLTRTVPDRALSQALGELRDPQRVCDYLVDAANRGGGPDNITVVVVELAAGWLRRMASRVDATPWRKTRWRS
jgi:PPM family protein phosphatase